MIDTIEARARFVLAVEETGSPTIAADRAGWHSRTAFQIRREDSDFRAAWDGARMRFRARQVRERGEIENPFEDPDVRDRYLAALEEHGLEATAAELAGVLVEHVDSYRRTSPEFRRDYAHALALFDDRTEAALIDRAVNGWEEPVYQGGVLVDTVRKFDNTAAARVLKARRERYQDSVKVEQDIRVAGGVLLVSAPAPDAKTWLESIDAKELPSGDAD